MTVFALAMRIRTVPGLNSSRTYDILQPGLSLPSTLQSPPVLPIDSTPILGEFFQHGSVLLGHRVVDLSTDAHVHHAMALIATNALVISWAEKADLGSTIHPCDNPALTDDGSPCAIEQGLGQRLAAQMQIDLDDRRRLASNQGTPDREMQIRQSAIREGDLNAEANREKGSFQLLLLPQLPPESSRALPGLESGLHHLPRASTAPVVHTRSPSIARTTRLCTRPTRPVPRTIVGHRRDSRIDG